MRINDESINDNKHKSDVQDYTSLKSIHTQTCKVVSFRHSREQKQEMNPNTKL